MTLEMQSDSADAEDLAAFGYAQQLHRKLGSYASFAAGFSFVSILTTVFELFGLGFSFGGAAFFWTWPLVFGGQLLVAFVFAELASRYPISGCIYQWSRRLTNPTIGWFAGWTMLVAQIVTIAAAAIRLPDRRRQPLAEHHPRRHQRLHPRRHPDRSDHHDQRGGDQADVADQLDRRDL
jgi:hypothetical protein